MKLSERRFFANIILMKYVLCKKYALLKTLFAIGSEKSGSDTLLLELGQDYCSYAFLNQGSKTFMQIRYMSYEAWEAEEKLSVILDQIKDEKVDQVIVCSAYAQALLVPQKEFTNYSLLDIFDVPAQKHFHDGIDRWQLVNAYGLPSGIYEIIEERFSPSHYLHVYTPGLKLNNGFGAADQIEISFTTQHFRVLVKKNHQVHLAQTYAYRTPLDVVYFLLKICYEFGLDQTHVVLVVSGLIDKDSALYQELHNYFLNLNFSQEPSYTLPENEHPHYYFNSLYTVAECVS
jgi:hypothetical protein